MAALETFGTETVRGWLTRIAKAESATAAEVGTVPEARRSMDIPQQCPATVSERANENAEAGTIELVARAL